MFDNIPNNLPVEPLNASAPVSPTAPSTPSTGKKEPEDMFAGLDDPSGGAQWSGAPTLPDDASHGGFPWRKILVLIVALGVIGGGGYALWEYVIAPKLVAKAPVVTAPVTPAATDTGDVETPPPEAGVTTQPVSPIAGEAPVEPVVAPPEGVIVPPPTPVETTSVIQNKDQDEDGLTDTEEALFQTDPLNKDSDGDGFGDGMEVRGGYDPKVVKANVISSALMTRRSWGEWSFLYPKLWSLEGQTPTTAILSTATQTTFRVEEISNVTESLDVWLQQRGQSGLVTIPSRTQLMIRMSADRTQAFVSSGQNILVIQKVSQEEDSAMYQASFEMFLATMNASTK